MDKKSNGAQGQGSFKDYCLILQLHPDADAEMVDAAYWHLARRYSERLGTDTGAKSMLDDLNEAYSVMRSSDRREEYNMLRDGVLGAGAIPVAPPTQPEHVLPVLGKEAGRIQRREGGKEPLSPPKLGQLAGPAGIQTGLAVAVMLVLGFVAFTTAPDPALVGALLFLGLAAIAMPLYRKLPAMSLAGVGTATNASLAPLRLQPEAQVNPKSQPVNSAADADALRAATDAIRARWRKAGDDPSKARASGFHTIEPSPAQEDVEQTIHAA
jgi:hypothetical protein